MLVFGEKHCLNGDELVHLSIHKLVVSIIDGTVLLRLLKGPNKLIKVKILREFRVDVQEGREF